MPTDVSVDNTPDEAAKNVPVVVDKEDQPPADDNVAVTSVADSREVPSGQERAEAEAGEVTSDPAAVPDLPKNVDEVAVSAELDEAAAAGE